MNRLTSFLRQVQQFVSNANVSGWPSALNVKGEREIRDGCPVDMLVIDTSGSMGWTDYPPSRLAGAKEAAQRFLQKRAATNPNAVAGIVAFGSCAHIVAHLHPVRDHLKQLCGAVDALACGGGTNTGAGLELAHDELRPVRKSCAQRIILLTDGHATEGPDAEAVAISVKEGHVQLDIIGVGGTPDEVNEPTLKRMASVVNQQRRYWFIKSVSELVQKFEALALREVR